MHFNGIKIRFTKNTKYELLSWLPVLYWLSNLFRMTGRGSVLYLSAVFVTGTIGLLNLLSGKKMLRTAVVGFMFLYLLTGVMNWLIIGNVSFRDIINDLMLFGVTISMFAYPQTYRNGVICYYLSVLVFLAAYFRGSYAFTVLTSSGNYVSVILILASAYYYFCVQNSDHGFNIKDILPALLSFMLAIWARGRGGILASALLLLLILFYYIRNYAKKNTRRFSVVIFSIIIVVTVLLLQNINLLNTFMSLGKWQYRGLDNAARELIWGSYFNNLKENPLYVIFGAPLNDIHIIYSYGNNTHNSFLQLHATNGLITFILFCILLIRSFIFYLKNNKELNVIAIIAIVVRGMTDKFIFGQYGMPIMLYLVLWPYIEAFFQNMTMQNSPFQIDA